MNLGNGLGGLVLMLLSVVWLAIFVPQWAKRSEEAENSASQRQSSLGQQLGQSTLSQSEIQLLRLTNTRNRMGALALVVAAVGALLAFLAAGTFLAGAGWTLVAVAFLSGGLSVAASRHRTKLVVQAKSDRDRQFSRAAQAQAVNLKAAPLPKRDWTPPGIPQPIRQTNIGQIVARGNQVVPIRVTSTPVEKVPREIAANEIDEILRRRRAN